MGMTGERTADLATLLAQAGWLRRFARALAGDAASADDLAQETMLSALRRPVPDGGAGRAWLATVARNLAIDRFRGSTRRERREESAAAHDLGAGCVASPEQLIGDAQIHRHVAEAIARLAEPFRRIVVLRFYEGLSSAEIARSLGEPEGTIRWRMKESLDRVRAELDARYGDDRAAWRAALAPLLPVPQTDTQRSPPAAARAPRGPAMASALVAVAAAGLLAMAIITVVIALVVRRSPEPAALPVAQLMPSGTLPASQEARVISARPVTRVGLPDTSRPLAEIGASAPPTPGRSDARSLVEELLEAIEGNDYDAFVAKGAPSFRAAADRATVDAASSALAGRLSNGHHISTLGNVRCRHRSDWFFKVEFDDGGDDALCTLAMDGWQVAGFLVTEPIPQLSEESP